MKTYKKFLNYLINRPRIVGWLAFLYALIVTQYVAYENYNAKKSAEYRTLQLEGNNTKDRLYSILNHSITTTRILAYFVEKGEADDFDAICADLLSRNKYIDALQLVEGTIITRTYPLESNETVIGFDIGTKYSHKSNSQVALNRKELYFEGPFELKQGGKGIVGRYPIFKNGQLWGFTAVIIRIETLLSGLGISSTGVNEEFIYEIKKDLNIAKTDGAFFNNNFDGNNEQDYTTYIGLGDWILSVKMRNSSYTTFTMLISIIGMLLSIMIGLIAWYFAYQPLKLKKLVDERTIELKQKNAELEQFAFVASHDLQEPLRTITTFLSKLNLDFNSELNDKAKLYIHFVNDAATRMRTMIIDLLKFSTANEINDEEFTQINLNETIHEIIASMQTVVEESNTKIKVSDLHEIYSIKSFVNQIIQNLISNAIKYKKENTNPLISVYSEIQDEYIVIHISDQGKGISPEYHDKIFELFQRLENSATSSGTGIGLTITKKLIERIGGKITVKSEEGKGSLFSVYFPKN